ncbi:MAG TPA: hypothetical protein VEK11_07030 [Thermoanaerobaculia bacterium]|nr:hypothetical protein [Thermoanaerobaculia bacterium]
MGRTTPTLKVIRRDGETAHRFPLNDESLALLFLPARDLSPGTYDIRSDEDCWPALGAPLHWTRAAGPLLVTTDVLLEPLAASATLTWTIDPALIEPRAVCGEERPVMSAAELRMVRCPAEIHHWIIVRSGSVPSSEPRSPPPPDQ